MRRPVVTLISVLGLLIAGVVPSGAFAGLLERGEVIVDAAAAGGLTSDNITYVGTLPIDSPGVGGQYRILSDADGNVTQRLFFTTGAKGLAIYDVQAPANPRRLGFLPLAHFQNEEVDVSLDGTRVIISTDTAGVSTAGTTANGVHVIDTTDKTNPRHVAFVARSNHTTTCADFACEWLYGSSGHILDATDVAGKGIVDTGKRWFQSGVSGSHALNLDESGLMISDSTPRLVLDVTDPANPVAIAEGTANVAEFGRDGLLQHNNVRPDATEWEPRVEGDDGGPLRPGEVFIGNSESNVNRNCNQAGGLSVWSMKNFDRGEGLQQLDVFRPFNGAYVSGGNPPANGLGCSGHWFTVQDGMIAASWYEHGVKVFAYSVDGTPLPGTDGKLLREVGFFQPIATQAGAAHWITDPATGEEYIYNVDYARGIDIVKFTRDTQAEPTDDELHASWRANAGEVRPLAQAERLLCRLAY
jgi:hypothetical protein